MTFAGLMSRWTSPRACASRSEPHTCVSDVHARGRAACGAVASHQLSSVDAVEVLHRVVEGAVAGAAVVVDLDRVGVRELARELHLALEARDQLVGGEVGLQHLDRRRPPEERVPREVDVAIPPSPISRSRRYCAERRASPRAAGDRETRRGRRGHRDHEHREHDLRTRSADTGAARTPPRLDLDRDADVVSGSHRQAPITSRPA